jgi:hypothetical protein
VNPLEIALRRIKDELNAYSARWAVVGGLAVSVRTEPRFTRDADLAVVVRDDREAESLVRWLLGRGYEVLASVEQQAVGRLATARLLPPGEKPEGLVVDLLFASSGIESEVVSAAEPIEILPDLTAPVARKSHLIALKVLSRDDAKRPTDLADLNALLALATDSEIQETREALALITERGFHRERELVKRFEELLRSIRS